MKLAESSRKFQTRRSERAANQETVIGELEKTLTVVVNEIAATEKAVTSLRDWLLVP